MKKILCFLILIVSAIAFTGCELLFDVLINDNNQTRTIEVSKNIGDVYLIKVNDTNYEIEYEKTGYVASNEKENDLITDYFNSFDENSSFMNLGKYGPQESSFVSNFNSSLAIKNQNKINRSINNDENEDTERVIVPDNSRIGDKMDYWYIAEEDNGKEIYKFREATCQYVGDYCTVWYIDDIDEKNNGFNLSLTDFGYGKGKDGADCSFSTLGKKFDSICELEEKYLGKHTYIESKNKYRLFDNIEDVFGIINPNEKITILVADLYGDAVKDLNGGVYGYFYSGDMFDVNQDIQDYENFYTNGIQMLYLDSYFYKYDTLSMYSTIVHEYNHLLNFVQKTVKYGAFSQTWFTEMLSLTAEDMFEDYLDIPEDKGPQGRLPYFNSYPYYGFTKWGTGQEVYISYANAYAFGAFLARNYGGLDIISQIATSRYIDTNAIENATGQSMSTLIENFAKTFLYTDKDYTNSRTKVYSLYKSANMNNTDGLNFKPIKLKEIQSCTEVEVPVGVEYDRYDREEEKFYQTIMGPVILKSNPYQKDKISEIKAPYAVYATPLLPQGFSVHYVGTNISSFDLKYNPYYSIEYSTVVK